LYLSIESKLEFFGFSNLIRPNLKFGKKVDTKTTSPNFALDIEINTALKAENGFTPATVIRVTVFNLGLKVPMDLSNDSRGGYYYIERYIYLTSPFISTFLLEYGYYYAMRKTVLITGIAGFMGSHLADKFLELGWNVKGIDNLLGGYEDNVPQKAQFHRLDLANLTAIKPIFEDVDVVIHSACTAYEGLSVFSPALIVQNTSQITATCLSASVSANVKKFIYLSSMARYGTQDELPFREEMIPNPQDPYGIAKYSSELLVKNICETQAMNYTILVPHNIIGPRQKYNDPYRNVASIMINRMLMGKPAIIYGDGEQKRCFSFMQDVVDPIVTCVEGDISNGRTINIGPDDEFITINELAKIISELIGFKENPIYMPGRPQEVKDANCSADLARELLAYRPQTNLRSGLNELVQWISMRGVKEFDYHLPIEFSNSTTPRTWTEKLM